MAVAISGATANGDTGTDAPTFTFPVTTVSGTDLLLVGATWQDTGLPTMTGGSFNSVAFDGFAIAAVNDASSRLAAFAYKLNPSIGSDLNCTINLSGNFNTIGAFAQGWSGTHPSAPIGDTDTDPNTGSTSASCTLTGMTADDASVSVLLKAATQTDSLAVGAGETQLVQSITQLYRYGGSYRLGTAGSTLNWTWSTSRSDVMAAVVLKAAAGYSVNLVSFDGVNDYLAR